MAWPFDTPEYSFPRPSGIDTPMNYQDQIRSLPGGNYQGWQDLIMDPVRQENLAESDFNRLYNMGAYDDEGTGQAEINYEDAPVPFSGFFTGNRRLHPNNPLLKLKTPLTGIMNAVRDQFEYRPATEQAWDPNTGEFISAEEQDRQNALGGYYSDAARHQRKQRARVINMMKRRDANKGYSEKNLQKLIDLGYGPQETITTTTTVGDNINQGGGGGSEAAFTQTSPGGISQQTSRDARGGMSGWRLAEGGRAGYRDGEFVDEDVNIAGPGFDVNENVMMASAPDPMDALNDFALEIFGKPLDMLNDEERGILYDLANEQAAIGEEQGIASLV